MMSMPSQRTDVILESERLQLRELRQSDFGDLYEMFNDPLVMKYYPSTRDERGTQEFIGWTHERYRRDGFGLWVAQLTESGVFVGLCGLLTQEVDGQREVEVGYLFKHQYWHRGYATEAAQACKQHAFKALGIRHVISLIRPINAPSRAVAERNGMSVWKTTIFREYEALVYRVDADDRDGD